LTTTASSFSHLYQLDVSDEQSLSKYYSKSRLDVDLIADRIPPLPVGGIDDEAVVDSSGIDWNNPVGPLSFGNSKRINGQRGSVFFTEWADNKPQEGIT